jgi:hypothetical protein
MWFEIAIASILFSVGSILFGRFENGTPWWRRLLKLAFFLAITAAAAGAGRAYALGWIAFAFLLGITFHFVWCRRNGIDPWTAEPWPRYAELRGWKP